MLNGTMRSVVIKGFVSKEKDFSSLDLKGSQSRVANTGEIRSPGFRTVSCLAAAVWTNLHTIPISLRVTIIQQEKYRLRLFSAYVKCCPASVI